MNKLLIFIILSLSFFSCRKDEIKQNDKVKSHFVITGHAYGNPGVFQLRLYKKLIPILAIFREEFIPTKFIFTGDVVAKPTIENWVNVVKEFDSLDLDFWIAPGNHDLGNSYFLDSVQQDTFFTERIENNLFIILNTNFDGWTISQPQINLIQKELSDLSSIQNIFVFSHQVWWANSLDAVYTIDSIRTNSKYLFNGPTSFWTDAFPLFQLTGLPTYFFSGDIGSWDFIPAYVENHFDNFHFYASGIGGGAEDNVLYLKTFQSGKVEIEKIDF